MALRIRRIDCTEENALDQIAAIRRQLSPDGEIVPERGRALTQRVFGEALSPVRSVERICRDVREQGFAAVQRYTQAFDNFALTPDNLRVGAEELAAAYRQCDPRFLQAVRRVQKAVLAFQVGILHRDAVLRDGHGQELRLRYRPVKRVGICVPGGAAAYPSTLLMTVCPARAAGVREIVVVAPPTPFGANNPDILAVCKELGVTEVYRIGGAQAVAALAYGIEGLPRVDMIVGPGNLFVALAKRFVFGAVGIDLLAGPSEVVVVADATARPDYVAADLIAQAEHAPGASLLVTWEPSLIEAVAEVLEEHLDQLPRSSETRESLEAFGALILTRGPSEAVDLVNAIAPEHLQLCTADADLMLELIENAGAIFLGHESPVALGDYVAGPSHVLPTGGTARFASGLTANDFLRSSSVIRFDRTAVAERAGDLRVLAAKEGLVGHSRSVDLRLQPASEIVASTS